MQEKTELILRNQDGEYAVTVSENEMNMQELLNLLVVPLFIAAGYTPETVLKRINLDEIEPE